MVSIAAEDNRGLPEKVMAYFWTLGKRHRHGVLMRPCLADLLSQSESSGLILPV
jgi:hypothetical protein